MDRPYLQGQIGLDLMPPLEVWSLVEYAESSPAQRYQLATPPLSTRIPRGMRSPAFIYAPMPLWQQQRAHRITAEQYAREIEWHSWAARNNPKHPDFTFRKPLDRKAVPAPRFAR